MHQFTCRLVGDNAASYCLGLLTSPREADIKKALARFNADTLWRMSKVCLDSKNKKEFNSAPLKVVVIMGDPTKFEPLLAGTHQLSTTLFPKTALKDILKLTERRGAFDVVGVLSKGPENVRTPTTKAGATTAADYELSQPSGSDDALVALRFTAWGDTVEALRGKLGKTVGLFHLDASLQDGARGKVQCETTRDGWVEELTPDGKFAELAARIQAGTAGASTLVTSQWSASAPTFNVAGHMPLVCASFLRALGEVASPAQPSSTVWQANGCHLDLPTETILTNDGSRIWFQTPLRDFSGDVSVWITEAAALPLSRLATRADFEAAFEAGELQFQRCNVRGGMRIRDGVVDYIIVQAEAVDSVQPITQSALTPYELQKICGRNSGGVVASPLGQLRSDAFAGLLAGDDPCAKALVFVQGLERSRMTNLGTQRKMTTPVKCIFERDSVDNSAVTYVLVGFCHENLVADYKIDTGRAVALVTNVEVIDADARVYELCAEFVMTVIADDAQATRKALRLQADATRLIPLDALPSVGAEDLSTSGFEQPPSAKRCRAIGQYPSDPA